MSPFDFAVGWIMAALCALWLVVGLISAWRNPHV